MTSRLCRQLMALETAPKDGAWGVKKGINCSFDCQYMLTIS